MKNAKKPSLNQLYTLSIIDN